MSVEVYYCKQSGDFNANNKISPAPTINITPEIYYSNDNPIGYTYNLNLKGYATAIRKDISNSSTLYGLEPVLDHIGDIRDIFNFNGGDLYIKNSGDMVIARGATIKNISFENSNDKWFNYAPYSIELEFNEIDLIGCSGTLPVTASGCSSSIFHQAVHSKNICDKLIDIKQNKIKQFSDKWTFNIDDKIYANYNNLLSNNGFEASYTISATGKNYYVNDQLIPAWQQAKIFVQNRLRNQVMSLINGTMQIEELNDNACSATKDISQIHDAVVGLSGGGMLSGFDTLRSSGNISIYDVYNETISCNASESDGSFSLNYKSFIKKSKQGVNPLANAATHYCNKDISITSSDTSISVKGTIQGLVRGGFIYYDFNDFQLPNSGSFIVAQSGSETKYENAKYHYYTLLGHNSDLFDYIKNQLNITRQDLLIQGNNNTSPTPASFVLDHNYTNGSIGYTATYSRSHTISQDRGYINISIIRNDPVDIIQEFIIPGRYMGPIIQKLNMKTARTISINIDGASQFNKTCIDSITDLCSYFPLFQIDGFENLINDSNINIIKTREDYTSNPVDGSFSISLEYISKN